MNRITPQHLWEPLLTALRELAGDAETVVKRRKILNELHESHGVDILGSPDERANDYFNKTIFLLRSANLISTVGRGQYQLTSEGLSKGLPPNTDFGSFAEQEDDNEEAEYLKPLWASDDYIVGLVAASAPCYGRYSARNRQCTHQCAVSGACHTKTLARLARCVDKCPDGPVLEDPQTKQVFFKMALGREAECALTGVIMDAGSEACFHPEVGHVTEEAARKHCAENEGWSIQ